MRRTKRLFYVPGLISLIGLLIGLPLLFKKIVPVKEYCLELFVPKDSQNDDVFVPRFSKYHLEKTINKKRKIKFALTEDREENKQKMKMIRYEALKLKYTEDTSTVILLILSDNLSYGEFVAIIDMCKYDNHKRFASWDNKFVIFGEWPSKKQEPIESCFLCNDVIYIKKQPVEVNFFERIVKQLKKYYTGQGLLLLSGWLVILLSFLFSTKRSSVLQEY